MEKCLTKPSISSKNYLKYTESIFRLLAIVLEHFKIRNNYINDLAVKGFVYIVKYLFLGTVFQDKILQTLAVQNSNDSVMSQNAFGKQDEEEIKDDASNYSDNDSNIGSTYTDSLSQDILMKAKTSA